MISENRMLQIGYVAETVRRENRRMNNPRLFTFVGGTQGSWLVAASKTIVGEPLTSVERLDIVSGDGTRLPGDFTWRLRGATSNERYVSRSEHDQLTAKQQALGRPQSNVAALIPIRKSAAWWALSQDERRTVFERSDHVPTGLKYLPAIARRLHHCRDLGENQPFDFLTLFDYSEADASAFEDLLGALRDTEEWRFVDREIDIRLLREDSPVTRG